MSKKRKSHANKHHALWTETEWDGNTWCQELRSNAALLIEMPVDLHNRLHDEVRPIPIMTPKHAKWVCQHFFPVMDWKQDLTQLIVLCSKIGAAKTAKALRNQYKFLCTHLAG